MSRHNIGTYIDGDFKSQITGHFYCKGFKTFCVTASLLVNKKLKELFKIY